jgi:hypothetical protein
MPGDYHIKRHLSESLLFFVKKKISVLGLEVSTDMECSLT